MPKIGRGHLDPNDLAKGEIGWNSATETDNMQDAGGRQQSRFEDESHGGIRCLVVIHTG